MKTIIKTIQDFYHLTYSKCKFNYYDNYSACFSSMPDANKHVMVLDMMCLHFRVQVLYDL